MSRLRVTHAQTNTGPILITDIDSGLPTKENAYLQKQAVYVPYSIEGAPGYIDLVRTDKVEASRTSGVIFKLTQAGYITTSNLS